MWYVYLIIVLLLSSYYPIILLLLSFLFLSYINTYYFNQQIHGSLLPRPAWSLDHPRSTVQLRVRPKVT